MHHKHPFPTSSIEISSRVTTLSFGPRRCVRADYECVCWRPNGEIEEGLTTVLYPHRTIEITELVRAGGARMKELAPYPRTKCLFDFLLAGQLRIARDSVTPEITLSWDFGCCRFLPPLSTSQGAARSGGKECIAHGGGAQRSCEIE
jgi:hypothetical protein